MDTHERREQMHREDEKDLRTREHEAPEHIVRKQTDARGGRDNDAYSVMRTDNPSADDEFDANGQT